MHDVLQAAVRLPSGVVLSPEADLFVEQACLAVSSPFLSTQPPLVTIQVWSAPCGICLAFMDTWHGREGTNTVLCNTPLGPRFNADLHR